jgi:predicted nuclease of predicted toxin-antitoxin system
MLVKIDENVPLPCVQVISAFGHDVATVYEEDLAGHPDTDVWEVVRQEQRLLITQDKGFGDIRQYKPGTHSGILLLRPPTQRNSDIISLLQQVLESVPLESIVGCLAVANPRRVRIRPATAPPTR